MRDRLSKWGTGVTAAAVLLGLAALVVPGVILLRPSGAPAPGPPVDRPVAAAGQATEEPTDGSARASVQDEGALETATFDVFLTRDPFQPVVPTPDDDAGTDTSDGSEGAGDAGADDGEGDGTAGDGDSTDDGADGHTHDADPGDPCVGEQEVVCDGRVVTLEGIAPDTDGGPTATVRVDTEVHEVRTGDVFAEHFRVLAVDPPCVTLLFGDDSFEICEGQQVLK